MTLQEALDKLPDTVEGIVELMKREGIVGTFSCTLCPLAVWLQKQTGRPAHVRPTSCALVGPDLIVDGARVMLPRAAQDFVKAFDLSELDRALYANARTRWSL